MPRVLWKGAISFGLVNIPVGLYTAEKRNDLDFTMLDRRNLAPVGYRRVNKESGEEVPWGEIVKGYEYEDGQYVVFTDEDFRRANVEATQTVDILGFVDGRALSPIYFETPYYLAPGKRGEKGYALLRETLKRADKVGIAQVVIRTKQHLAALIPNGKLLLLNTLRYSDEIRSPVELDLPTEDLKEVGLSEKEIDMALRLVEGMSEEWEPERYHDTYRRDILKRIDEKIAAGETKTITEPPKEGEPEKGAEVIDLMALLKRSIETTPKGKPAPRRKAEEPPPMAAAAETKKQAKRSVKAAPRASSSRKKSA